MKKWLIRCDLHLSDSKELQSTKTKYLIDFREICMKIYYFQSGACFEKVSWLGLNEYVRFWQLKTIGNRDFCTVRSTSVNWIVSIIWSSNKQLIGQPKISHMGHYINSKSLKKDFSSKDKENRSHMWINSMRWVVFLVFVFFFIWWTKKLQATKTKRKSELCHT